MSQVAFSKAVRRAVPLLFGLVGPSGTGKTFSALRLATGMQKATGGRIKMIDTEHHRGLMYADQFDFDYFDFEPPYSSLRYLEILRVAAATPGPVIVDSMSHEHEGEGGYIDLHDTKVKRLTSTGGFDNEAKANWPAWSLPAKNRGKLIQGIITLGLNAIFCFRAKEKTEKGERNGRGTVEKLGWMPIAGDAFWYEMTATALLHPDMQKGVPIWNPEFAGEKAVCKLPGYFREHLMNPDGTSRIMSEEVGEKLARWARGLRDVSPENIERFKELLSLYPLSSSAEGWANLEERRKLLWADIDASMQAQLKQASLEASTRNKKTEVLNKAPTMDNQDVPPQAGSPPGKKRNPNYVHGIDEPSAEWINT